ncbi:MAG: hypothetical protein ACRDJF_08770, partial [Actinomycetota bacterium]
MLTEEGEPDPGSRLRALLGPLGGLFFPETPDPLEAPPADDSLLPQLRETPIGRLVLPGSPEGIGWLLNLIRALVATLAIFGAFWLFRPRVEGERSY